MHIAKQDRKKKTKIIPIEKIKIFLVSFQSFIYRKVQDLQAINLQSIGDVKNCNVQTILTQIQSTGDVMLRIIKATYSVKLTTGKPRRMAQERLVNSVMSQIQKHQK